MLVVEDGVFVVEGTMFELPPLLPYTAIGLPRLARGAASFVKDVGAVERSQLVEVQYSSGARGALPTQSPYSFVLLQLLWPLPHVACVCACAC